MQNSMEELSKYYWFVADHSNKKLIENLDYLIKTCITEKTKVYNFDVV